MPPRVLIVVNDAAYFIGQWLPFARGIRAAGFDVHVATPPDDASPGIEAAGLPFHPVPLSRRGMSPFEEAKTIGALTDLYRALRPTLVHHITAKPNLYGGIAARLARVPAVVHAVSGLGFVFISDRPHARVLRHAVRATYRLATGHPNCAVVFQNDDDRRTLGSGIRTPNVVTIPGVGIDGTVFRRAPLPEGVPIVVLPARMLWDKGIREFVEAAAILKRRGVVAELVLVGGVDDGNPAAVPAEEIDRWVAEGVVAWWGFRQDMPEVLAKATIVCLPSYREGLPTALLEACTVGRPIVTTDVPGCRDVVGDADFGVLVPPRDARALADALGALLADRPRLERMAASAAAAAASFAVEHVVARTVALYRQLIDAPA